MNKILFISCCVPDELETEITQYCKSSINIHDAANTFQKSLIQQIFYKQLLCYVHLVKTNHRPQEYGLWIKL